MPEWLRWGRAHLLWLTPGGVCEIGTAQPAMQGFADWCAAHRGSRCRLLASADCLHLVDADPALGLRRQADIAAHVQAQLMHYHGSAAAGWPLQAWHEGGRSGASSWHRPDRASLLDTACAHRVRVEGVHPGWCWARQRAAEGGTANGPGAALWVLDEGRVATVLVFDDGSLRSACVRRHDGELLACLPAWRKLTGLGTDAPLRVVDVQALLSAGSSRRWVGGLGRDAASGSGLLGAAQASPLAWVAAAAAGVMLLVSALDASEAWGRLTQARLTHAAGSAAQADPHEASPAAAAYDPTARNGAAADEDADAWRASLRRPWRGMIGAVEAASLPGLHWLSQEHAAEESRLSARVDGLDAALAAAAALRRQDGVRSAEVEHMASDADGVQAHLRVHWQMPPGATSASATAGQQP